MRLTDFVDQVYVLERSLACSSIRQLRMSCQFLEQYDRCVSLANISHETINRWLADNPRSWSPRTLKRRRDDVLAVWSYAVETGHCEHDPNRRRIRRVRIPKKIPDAWSVAEIRQMRRATTCAVFDRYLRNGIHLGHLLDSVIVVGFYSALRPQDLMTLERHHLIGQGRVGQRKLHGSEVLLVMPEWVVDLIADRYPPWINRIWAWPHRLEYFYPRWKAMLRHAGLPATKRDCLQKLRRTAVSHGEAVRVGYGATLAGHQPGSRITYEHYVDPSIIRPSINELPDIRAI